MQAHHCDDAALSGSVEQLPELQAFHASNSSQHQHLKPISGVQSVQKQDERHNKVKCSASLGFDEHDRTDDNLLIFVKSGGFLTVLLTLFSPVTFRFAVL